MNRIISIINKLESMGSIIDGRYSESLNFILNGPNGSLTDTQNDTEFKYSCDLPGPRSRDAVRYPSWDMEYVDEISIGNNTSIADLIKLFEKYPSSFEISISEYQSRGNSYMYVSEPGVSSEVYDSYIEDYGSHIRFVKSCRDVVERNRKHFYDAYNELLSIDNLSPFESVCLYSLVVNLNLQTNCIPVADVEKFTDRAFLLLGIRGLNKCVNERHSKPHKYCITWD